MTNTSQAVSGVSYDAAGNVLYDGNYVLGLSGEQVTEMGMDSNNTLAWQHTNVSASGQLIGTYDTDGLHFYLNDPLGTRRAQTDYAGVPEQSCSSLPFGDGLACSGSTQFPTEHHFTGKERDIESGNDYFGARYYASNMGRFMSPDWSAKEEPVPYATMDDPQSLNLYSYVKNNPLSHVDADGHEDPGCLCQVTPQQLFNSASDASVSLLNTFLIGAEGAYSLVTTGHALNAQQINQIENPSSSSAPAPDATTQRGTGDANTPKSDLPRAPNGDYLPSPEAEGAHTTLGTRPSETTGKPYTQGATFDGNGKFKGRTDVTDHGRPSKHPNPHFHPATSPNGVGGPGPIPQAPPTPLTPTPPPPPQTPHS